MNVKKDKKGRKKFIKEEKLTILKEASEQEVMVTPQKYANYTIEKCLIGKWKDNQRTEIYYCCIEMCFKTMRSSRVQPRKSAPSKSKRMENLYCLI